MINDENEGIALISYEILEKNSIKCDDCGETIKNYSVIRCGDCLEDLFNNECLFESLKFVASDNDYLWNDEDSYDGFATKEDKLLFMKGVNKGFFDALFWICDHYGMVDKFENELERLK